LIGFNIGAGQIVLNEPVDALGPIRIEQTDTFFILIQPGGQKPYRDIFHSIDIIVGTNYMLAGITIRNCSLPPLRLDTSYSISGGNKRNMYVTGKDILIFIIRRNKHANFKPGAILWLEDLPFKFFCKANNQFLGSNSFLSKQTFSAIASRAPKNKSRGIQKYPCSIRIHE